MESGQKEKESMINEYINFVEEWCEILESKFKAKYPTNPPVKYGFKINKKYTKIVRVDSGGGGSSVHAFVDNNILDILKAATWNSPAKGARYNLAENFDRVLEVCDPNGGYLYSGRKVVV